MRKKYTVTLNLVAALAENISKALACLGCFSHVLTFQVSQALIFGPPMPNFNKLNFLVLFTKMLGDLMILVWPKTYMGARQFS